MIVKVYKNLNNSCFSIMAAQGEHAGRVIAHASAVQLLNSDFVVYESGRQRVIQTKRKNVHAFVTGTLYAADIIKWRYPVDVDLQPIGFWPLREHCRTVTYNPYAGPWFVDSLTGAPVMAAESVLVDCDGLCMRGDIDLLGAADTHVDQSTWGARA